MHHDRRIHFDLSRWLDNEVFVELELEALDHRVKIFASPRRDPSHLHNSIVGWESVSNLSSVHNLSYELLRDFLETELLGVGRSLRRSQS